MKGRLMRAETTRSFERKHGIAQSLSFNARSLFHIVITASSAGSHYGSWPAARLRCVRGCCCSCGVMEKKKKKTFVEAKSRTGSGANSEIGGGGGNGGRGGGGGRGGRGGGGE